MTAIQPIPLFRPEVLAARKDRLHGDVCLAIPLSWQLIGWLIFVALALVFWFLSSATYSRVETVPGSIVVDSGAAAIVPTRAGVIAELTVRDGQHVRAGDRLLRMRVEEDLVGGGTAPQRALSSLKQQDRQLGVQAALVLSAAASERSRLGDSVRGAEDELIDIARQIAGQEQLIILAENQLKDAESIAVKGFVSRRDLDERRATLIDRQQRLAQLRQAQAEKSASIKDAQRNISQTTASAQAQAVSIQSQRTQLAQPMAQFDAGTGYALTAPVSGKVTAVTARLGQAAAAGDQLLVVIPDGSRVSVELFVPTAAAGFLRVGQEVRLAVDAFPYETFGTVQAHIADVSATAVPKQTRDGTVPVYLVKAQLVRPSIEAFGKAQPLLPGMALTARIVTRKQSLLQWLFEPLFAVGRR